MDYLRFGPEIKTAEQLKGALEIVDAVEDVEKTLDDRVPRILAEKWHRLPTMMVIRDLVEVKSIQFRDSSLSHLMHEVLNTAKPLIEAYLKAAREIKNKKNP